MTRARGIAAAPACALALALAAAAAGCGGGEGGVPGGSAERGRQLIAENGCGSCHRIAGIEQATGDVGPRLTDFRAKRRIARRLPNNPESVVRWLLNPQAVKPNTLMPNLRLTPEQARDIADYLYTQ